MNKKGFWKVLMVSLVMASAIGLLARGAMAQVIPTQQQLQDELGLQIGQTVLLDNFQYWTSPRDMGWRPVEPAFPIYGAGIGYGNMETVVDFQEGSRVMDVYCPPSVFMQMSNPTMMPYTATKAADYRDTAGVEHTGIPGTFNNISFKLRAPLSVELFDTFRVVVRVRTWRGSTIPFGAPNVGNGFVNTYPVTANGTAGGPYGDGTAFPVALGEDANGNLVRNPGEDLNNNGILDEGGVNLSTPNYAGDAANTNEPLLSFLGAPTPLEVPYGAANVGCPACTPTAPFGFGIAEIELMPRDFNTGCDPDDVRGRILSNPLANAVGGFAANSPETAFYGSAAIPGAAPVRIGVAMGRQFQDGSWHVVSENLNSLINFVSNGAENIFQIVSVTVRGNQYRLDDLMFTNPAASVANNTAPYLFRVGPVYGQLFNQGQTRAIFAEDKDFYWLYNVTGAVSDADGIGNQMLNAAINGGIFRATANLGADDFPFVAGNTVFFGAGLTAEQNYFLDMRSLTVPNPAPGAGSLNFITTIGDALGPQQASLSTEVPLPLSLNGVPEGDGEPTRITLSDLDIAAGAGTTAGVLGQYMNRLAQQGIIAIPAMGVPSAGWIMNNGTGAAAGNPMYEYLCLLINSGYTSIPNVQLLNATGGQVLEDMIVTCRVQDGLSADSETFPISVVNYPVTNLPPVIEQLEDRFFTVGVNGTYQITATDPDSFTGMGAVPNAGQNDLFGLTYKATLNGIPNYQYGPWMNSIINPISGLVSFTPQFEGSMTCIVTVTDPRGAQAVGHFNIFAVNPGTWLNHAPAVLEIIESPQTVRAGQSFIISDLRIADPDNEQLYYSCNIGSVGRNGVFAFQSEFPGEYLVQITAYDIRGGAVTQQFVLQVMPWWSF